MGIEERYGIVPYMEAYDKLSIRWRPFMMYSHEPNYSSDVVNTDQNGFRHTYDRDLNLVDFDTPGPINLISGGSTAFGIGASRDKMTLSSMLSRITGDIWLNYGGRGYSSSQEVILFLLNHQRHKRINKIILFSGANDLVLYYMNELFDKETGSFFFCNKFYKMMDADLRFRNFIARPLLSFFVKIFHGDEVDCSRLTLRQCMGLLKNRSINLPSIVGDSYEKMIDHDNIGGDIFYVINKNIINMKMIANYHGAELIYVLQPWAYCLDKRVLSCEEEKLFDILDKSQGKSWKSISEKVKDKYPWYSNRLKELCSSANIRFYDINSLLNDSVFDKQHVFVDRVHLTDLGYELVSDYIKGKL